LYLYRENASTVKKEIVVLAGLLSLRDATTQARIEVISKGIAEDVERHDANLNWQRGPRLSRLLSDNLWRAAVTSKAMRKGDA
jgi:hypothetical protein